jgi:hypothetical protein
MKPTNTVTDLEPTVLADGRLVWSVPDTVPARSIPLVQPTPPGSPVLASEGKIGFADSPDALSTLPTDRLAADDPWGRIIRSIQQSENGGEAQDTVEVRPGGQLVPVHKGQAGTPLSTLPEDRLAAPARTSRADLDEARRLDPDNVERWAFVDDEQIPGLTFEMAPVAQLFRFFCFRVAPAGGRWYLSVLDPDLDRLVGHEHHVMRLDLGGAHVPIVCRRNRDSSHSTLGEVRGTAAKFALYHSLRAHGHVPFSA